VKIGYILNLILSEEDSLAKITNTEVDLLGVVG
jgi:hypothetical protein